MGRIFEDYPGFHPKMNPCVYSVIIRTVLNLKTLMPGLPESIKKIQNVESCKSFKLVTFMFRAPMNSKKDWKAKIKVS